MPYSKVDRKIILKILRNLADSIIANNPKKYQDIHEVISLQNELYAKYGIAPEMYEMERSVRKHAESGPCESEV